MAVVVWDLIYQGILYCGVGRGVAQAHRYHVVKDKSDAYVHLGLKTVCPPLM